MIPVCPFKASVSFVVNVNNPSPSASSSHIDKAVMVTVLGSGFTISVKLPVMRQPVVKSVRATWRVCGLEVFWYSPVSSFMLLSASVSVS